MFGCMPRLYACQGITDARMTSSLAWPHSRQVSRLKRGAMLAAVAVSLTVTLAWRTTVVAIRPMGHVEAAAHRIAAGDYGRRVSMTGARRSVCQAHGSQGDAAIFEHVRERAAAAHRRLSVLRPGQAA